MSKNSAEIAGDIVTAWLNAIGTATSGCNNSVPTTALDYLSSQEKIADFYKLILKAVKEG